ncbi:MAG: glycosyltransferase family 2 protein [Hyphomicrobiaceae bacterium]|nr:glycosyltransferase family 2 protein [Hyphomicrobiaceae bacterium]
MYEQYPPRRLFVPPEYHRARADDVDLAFAIVTPSYEQREFLEEAIASVRNQSYPRIHYTVQDGASSDGSVELLASYGDHLDWRSEPDQGQADAINRGFRRVSGEIMAWLNSDDVLAPGAIPYVARFFARNPDVDIVYGHRIYIDTVGREVGRCILPRHDGEALRWADYVPQETLFWRRRVWDAIGPLDTSFRYALDYDFILRALRAGFTFARLPRFLGMFRVHPAQKTATMQQLGNSETARLHLDHLGYAPTAAEIRRRIKPYLKRHMWLDIFYRLGFVRF